MAHTTPRALKYPVEMLAPVVAASTSISEVCTRLGIKPHGLTNAKLRALITQFNLPTSHFKQMRRFTAHQNGYHSKIPASQILVLQPDTKYREHTCLLRRSLLEVGVPHICAKCGCPPMWQGESLTLEIDHENGKLYDNRRENLRFLCPNCHSQTPTFGVRNLAREAGFEPASSGLESDSLATELTPA